MYRYLLLIICLCASALSAKVLFIVGPSGVGKSTALRQLIEESDGKLLQGLSHTTRSPRANEKDGQDYHFISLEQFQKMQQAGDFLYHCTEFGNCYGVTRQTLFPQDDRWVVKDIGVESIPFLRKELGNEALFVFLAPPSLDELKRRLRKRSLQTGESESAIEKRFQGAKQVLARQDECDLVISAQDTKSTVAKLNSLVSNQP